jgi:predicted RNA-binding protein (TIGR00451 family)
MTSNTQYQGPIAIYNRFSTDVVNTVGRVFPDSVDEVLEALAAPVRIYYVRCNTLKISPSGLVQRLENLGLNVERNNMIPEAIGIHAEGPFELPDVSKKVVVDKHTAESVLQGANVYAPGIVSCGSMRTGDDVSIVTEYGEVIATGRVIMSANEVLTFRKGLSIRTDHRRFVGPRIRELTELAQGLFYPQSMAAMVTARVMDPRPEETIVDMSCAPGGKLSHISQLMDNSGRVLGFDRNHEKMRRTRENMLTLGCNNTVLSIHDSRYLHEDLHDLQADRVLVDPPCSALGLRPKIYDFTTLDRIKHLADYQKQFIKTASEIVKPGGVIVYSVCTFAPQECEEVVQFAEQECGLRAVKQEPFLASSGLPEYGPAASLCQRFHPHTHEIGYFIAKFLR